MKIFIQITIIAFVSLIGVIISYLLNLLIPFINIPGSLIGMVLLFIILIKKYIALEQIEQVSNFLIQNMGYFFIPLAVSVMDYFDILKDNLFKILFVITLSFLITFTSIALSVQLTLNIVERKKNTDA